MNAATIPLKSGEFTEAANSLDGRFNFRRSPCFARAHLLEVRVKEHVRHLLEIAINAEIASGYDDWYAHTPA